MSSGFDLLTALEYLKNEEVDYSITENFRDIAVTLGKTNRSLESAWDSISAAYFNVDSAVDRILSGVYVSTAKFAEATIENEAAADKSAHAFMDATNDTYNAIIQICNKYGISGND